MLSSPLSCTKRHDREQVRRGAREVRLDGDRDAAGAGALVAHRRDVVRHVRPVHADAELHVRIDHRAAAHAEQELPARVALGIEEARGGSGSRSAESTCAGPSRSSGAAGSARRRAARRARRPGGASSSGGRRATAWRAGEPRAPRSGSASGEGVSVAANGVRGRQHDERGGEREGNAKGSRVHGDPPCRRPGWQPADRSAAHLLARGVPRAAARATDAASARVTLTHLRRNRRAPGTVSPLPIRLAVLRPRRTPGSVAPPSSPRGRHALAALESLPAARCSPPRSPPASAGHPGPSRGGAGTAVRTLAVEDTMRTEVLAGARERPARHAGRDPRPRARGEAHRDSLIRDRSFLLTMRVVGHTGDRASRRNCSRSASRRSGSVARTATREVELRHWEKHPPKKDKDDEKGVHVEVSGGEGMTEEHRELRVPAGARGASSRYHIVGRELLGDHLIYRIAFEPRSPLRARPARRDGVGGHARLRDRAPGDHVPAVARSRSSCAASAAWWSSAERVGELWVLSRVLVRIETTIPIPRYGTSFDFGLQFSRLRDQHRAAGFAVRRAGALAAPGRRADERARAVRASRRVRGSQGSRLACRARHSRRSSRSRC